MHIRRLHPTRGISQQKFKETMSRLSMQTMIMTTTDMKGATLGSVTSLSLNPIPMIQFNLQIPSFSSQQLHKSRKFTIHLMPPTKKSVHLAKMFSKGAIKQFEALKPNQDFFIHKIKASNGSIPTTIIDKNQKLTPTNKPKSANTQTHIEIAILKSAERVLMCETIHCIQVYDHEIWVGRVEEILSPMQEHMDQKNNDEITGGLIYCNRKFYKIGNPL